MRFSHRQKHMIDLIFPVSLFFVFTLLALTVILMATNVYQKTTEESRMNYTAQTSLSYIREKISQADQDGRICLTTLDGCDALCLTQERDDSTYHTYIYACDGSLRHLFRLGRQKNPLCDIFFHRRAAALSVRFFLHHGGWQRSPDCGGCPQPLSILTGVMMI